jgi:hypothetical protein
MKSPTINKIKLMKKLAFFSTQFEDGSAAQQLIDRFLTGWPSDGRFIKSPFEKFLPMDQV